MTGGPGSGRQEDGRTGDGRTGDGRAAGSTLRLLASVDSYEDALAATLRLACDEGEWAYGEAWLPAEGPRAPAVTCDPTGRVEAFASRPPRATDSEPVAVARAAETGRAEWVADLASLDGDAWAARASAAGFVSAVAVPVGAGDDRAVLAFYAETGRSADEAFVDAVTNSAATLGRPFRPTSDRGELDLLGEVLRTSPAGIVVHDPERGTERVNPAAASLLGVDADTVVRRGLDWTAWTVTDAEEPPAPGESFPFAAALREREAVVDRRLVVARPDGSEVTLSVTAVPVLDDRGAVARVLLVFTDATERAHREAELEEKTRQLESFASVLSHDVRSPLAVATGFLELARETGDLSHLEKVERSHERIESLVDTLLVLARKGRTVGEPTSVDLAAVAAAAWEQVDAPDATLEVRDVGPLAADAARLQQALENLFRNSVQHGRPDARIAVGPLEEEPGFVVEDDGPGIPPEKRRSVLRPGHESSGGGYGLGLSIVAAVAEGHGWDLRVTERDGGGARFEFRTVEE